MTGTPDPALVGILARTRCILLDFDGPVCRLWAGYPASAVARDVRQMLAYEFPELPQASLASDDPLKVFTTAAALLPETAGPVHQLMCEAEHKAARSTAQGTNGAAEFLRACKDTGRPLAIVTNNSRGAAEIYLKRSGLADLVAHVAGRTDPDPLTLKPSPYLLRQAIHKLDTQPEVCAMIGDTPSDIQAAIATGTFALGYSTRPPRRRQLSDAGAATVAHHMLDLAQAVHDAAALR